jgi:protein O-GlcNAc transferase
LFTSETLMPPRPPSIQEIYHRQAEALERETRTEWEVSLTKYRAALQQDRRSPEAYIEAARCLKKLGKHEDAIALLKEGIQSCAPSITLHRWYVNLCEECNRTEEAIAAAHQATIVFPDELWPKLREALLLPILYDTNEEVTRYRDRFTEGLHKISEQLLLDTQEARRKALSAIGNQINAMIGYQGNNDRQLQIDYGEFVHRIMAANYPQWIKPLRMPKISDDSVLRVGYVSSRFRNVSAVKYFLGWLREHNPETFAIYAYHVGRKTDVGTAEAQRIKGYFRHLPNGIEETVPAILADRLHILVFLDIGLHPSMAQLAALRLAAIQCAAWDQPITSGLPTIDYFISSALAEPEDAQEHYSEKLVLLPGVGVCYQKPVIPKALFRKTRQDFQLRADAVVYLCCQHAYKYLPEQDEIFVRIAKRVPQAQFVFVTDNSVVRGDLRKRLERAFSGGNLRANDHCVVLSTLDRFSYWNLYLVGDVVLDTIGWSGGVSTFEAIACGLPIVTMPGRFMRGRQSYAILTQMEITETIARNQAEYIDLAARLGLEPEWRNEVIQRMSSRHSLLYSDKRCIVALQEFFEGAIREVQRRHGIL